MHIFLCFFLKPVHLQPQPVHLVKACLLTVQHHNDIRWNMAKHSLHTSKGVFQRNPQSCSASDHVQDSSHRVQVSPWFGAAVLHADVIRCWSSSSAIRLHSPAHRSTHEDKLLTATVVSPFMVPSCGILCHTTCGQLAYLWPLSEIDWKHPCLTLTRSSAFAALANLGYISDIIIIINLKIFNLSTGFLFTVK